MQVGPGVCVCVESSVLYPVNVTGHVVVRAKSLQRRLSAVLELLQEPGRFGRVIARCFFDPTEHVDAQTARIFGAGATPQAMHVGGLKDTRKKIKKRQ